MYQAAWTLEPGFTDLTKKAWEGKSWHEGHKSFTESVTVWNDKVVGNIPQRKRRLIRRLEGIDLARNDNRDNGLFRLEKKLWREYVKLSNQEEMIWFQKSRCKWLLFGDKNSSFFHMSTKIRRKRSKIESLQIGDGVWTSEQETMKRLAYEFYKNLYIKDPAVLAASNWPKSFPPMSSASLTHLQRDPTDQEIKDAVFDMGAFKAPGPDGLPAHFLQLQWGLIGGPVCDMIKGMWRNPREIESINQTSIVLIPKVDQPSKMVEFRPISLCNVIYKTLSKVIANRLRGEMEHLVLPNQFSFIKGRQGCDNIIIVQEAIHSMRTCRRGDGYVAVKVDMEKAYDRLDWGFLEFTLQGLGLNREFIELIMCCVSTVTMRVLWQDTLTESFKPTRGVRQGDPLSPYLFVLCMERLGQLIHQEVEDRHWKPFPMSARGPYLSHLFFADDLVLFGEASERQMENMREIMKFFCGVSGHNISLNKSKMFVSKNVHASRALLYSQMVGIGLTPDLGKYLGVPILHGKLIKRTFGPLIQKVRGKLASWKSKFLSMAGKTVLIKAVLSSIPYYQMQTLLIPRGVLRDLEKISRDFFWNQNSEGRKLHMISWDVIKSEKECGGLGSP